MNFQLNTYPSFIEDIVIPFVVKDAGSTLCKNNQHDASHYVMIAVKLL